MGDLTLADFVGCVREKPGAVLPLSVYHTLPFVALLKRANRPTHNCAAELVVVKMGQDHLRFLRSQFPSLRLRYLKGATKGYRWWMNERDYALMRTFFGGAW